MQERDRDLSISGCTAAIRSGQWQGKDLAWAYYNRGLAYLHLGDHARAIKDYDQALRLDPGFAIAYNNRGLAYNNVGEYRRAIEDFDRALRLNPGFAWSYVNRCWANVNIRGSGRTCQGMNFQPIREVS